MDEGGIKPVCAEEALDLLNSVTFCFFYNAEFCNLISHI
jgi:hypothetical protein